MTAINLHKEKADYFEDMSSLLLKMSTCCAITFGDSEVMDELYPYKFSLDKDNKILEKALKKCTKKLKDFLSAKPEHLSVFFKMHLENLRAINAAERENLTILANLNLAFSEIHRMLSRDEINKNEYELWEIEQEILSRSNKAIGYWAAKLENYKPVIEGAIKRKEISTKKVNDILKLCQENEIYSAKDFKNDKLKRQRFMNEAKDKLNLFSERRVLEYLKMIEPLKEEIITKSRDKGKHAR